MLTELHYRQAHYQPFMMRFITIILLTFSFSLIYGQDTLTVDTVTIVGTIERIKYFRIDPNDTLNPILKSDLSEMQILYSNKKDLMTDFVLTLPHNFEKADKMKRKDKILNKLDESEIILAYELGKFREYNMLFQPWFEITDDIMNTLYVSCSKEQLNELPEINENRTKITFKLKYLGEFNFSSIIACRLISYKILEDK